MSEETKQQPKKNWHITEGKNVVPIEQDGENLFYRSGKKLIFVPKEQVFEATENEIYDWEVKNKSAIGLYNKSENVVGRTLEDLAEGFVAPASSIVSDFIPADGLLGISKQTLQNAGRGIDAALLLSPAIKAGTGVAYNVARPVMRLLKPLKEARATSTHKYLGNPKKMNYIEKSADAELNATVRETIETNNKNINARFEELLNKDYSRMTNAEAEELLNLHKKYPDRLKAEFGAKYDEAIANFEKNSMLRAEAVKANAKAKAIGTLEGIARYASSKRDATAVINAGFGLLDKDPEWLKEPYKEDE